MMVDVVAVEVVEEEEVVCEVEVVELLVVGLNHILFLTHDETIW